jgi:adenine deaminase
MFHVEHLVLLILEENAMKHIEGSIVDVINRRIFEGFIVIDNGRIVDIREQKVDSKQFLLPGLIDSHVHIESSMLIPQQFAKLVVPRGTIAVVSDPHEIANVLGEEGVDFMLADAKMSPLKFFFGVPSCVPATAFETSGATMGPDSVSSLFKKGCWFLSEMMNFPGVIQGDEKVLRKIEIAKSFKKPIDGHAPGLTGKDLRKYVYEGITTDHECCSLEEALEKMALGMSIQIREGSAAKNYNTLSSLIHSHPNQVMFCTDDSHPDEIVNHGHIDKLVRRGLDDGYSIFDLLQVACVNPVRHYQLPVGLLQKGDPADFICVDNLTAFNVLETYINGNCLYHNGDVCISVSQQHAINAFSAHRLQMHQLEIFAPSDASQVMLQVIECFDGDLYTKSMDWKPTVKEDGKIETDIENDILKLVVLNRYQKSAQPSVGFIKNIGIKRGAFGGTIAHDSHNIIAVGADDISLLKVINALVDLKGGIVAYDSHNEQLNYLELPFGGLMTNEDGENVALKYEALNNNVKHLGSQLSAPFMTLAFMSLLVIPELKLGDKGLFNVTEFSFTPLLKLKT